MRRGLQEPKPWGTSKCARRYLYSARTGHVNVISSHVTVIYVENQKTNQSNL